MLERGSYPPSSRHASQTLSPCLFFTVSTPFHSSLAPSQPVQLWASTVTSSYELRVRPTGTSGWPHWRNFRRQLNSHPTRWSAPQFSGLLDTCLHFFSLFYQTNHSHFHPRPVFCSVLLWTIQWAAVVCLEGSSLCSCCQFRQDPHWCVELRAMYMHTHG